MVLNAIANLFRHTGFAGKGLPPKTPAPFVIAVGRAGDLIDTEDRIHARKAMAAYRFAVMRASGTNEKLPRTSKAPFGCRLLPVLQAVLRKV
jgi:hypothetical protein